VRRATRKCLVVFNLPILAEHAMKSLERELDHLTGAVYERPVCTHLFRQNGRLAAYVDRFDEEVVREAASIGRDAALQTNALRV
jgi:hypothetical protein